MTKKILKRPKKIAVEKTKQITNPELVFGIVGPIGVDLNPVIDSLEDGLGKVGYKPFKIHLTELMETERINVRLDNSTYFKRYKSLISYANAFRKAAKNGAALAGVAILEIRRLRAAKTGSSDQPSLGAAYIVRQFKRPEEVELMRRVYGRKFVLVSVYGSESERRAVLMDKIRRYENSPKDDGEIERQAIELIGIDNNQIDDANGQRISDVFHLGDVFVDGTNAEKSSETMHRFVKALFGATGISPSKDEYGLYIAAAAGLRSVDLSRQVGAAIFSKASEVIALGCNEVPKAGGGTYWSDDAGPKYRDVEIGTDANQERKNEIFFDLVERLGKEHFLSRSMSALETQKRVDRLLSRQRVVDSQLMDIIEFGRMVHAEMSAISDAARLGRSVKNATLFCTTFPCHLCAKHVVASGISRLVFLEPYPKSYARKLHPDSITFERKEAMDVGHSPEEGGKVLFEPFIGISPRRYRDIFEKKKRKDDKGHAMPWYESGPIPMIEDKSGTYVENEEPAVYVALESLFVAA